MSGTPPAGKKRKRVLGGLVGCVVIVGLVIVGVLVVIGVLGWQDFQQSARVVTDIEAPDMDVPQFVFSPDQQAVVGDLGLPESFTILFYDSEIPGETSHRLETWFYYTDEVAFTFLDGLLEAEEDLPPAETIYPAVQYTPEQFVAFMSLDMVLSVTDINEYIIEPMEPELLNGGELYFADQLSFGLLDDRLVYVETLAFEETE